MSKTTPVRHPLLSIWYAPYATVDYLEKDNDEKKALIVMVIVSAILALSMSLFPIILHLINFWMLPSAHAALTPIFDIEPETLIIASVHIFIVMPLAGWLFFRLFPVLLHRFACPFGAKGSEDKLRIVIGWGQIIPVSVLILIILIVLSAAAVIQNIYQDIALGQINPELIDTVEQRIMILQAVLIVAVTLLLCVGVTLYTHLIAASERICAWRAFGALCFASIVPGVLLIAFFIWVNALLHMFD